MPTLLGRWITTPTRLLVAILVCFAVTLACGIAVGELLKLAERPGGATAIDSSITSWLVAHRTHALTSVARLLSTLGSQAVLIPVVAVVTVILLGRRMFVLAGLLVVTWAGAIGLYSLIKDVVDRMRPPRHIWLTQVGPTPSFPSGHATQSMATFIALAVVGAVLLPRSRRPARVIAIALALGVGWSRAYLGVHWATDVAAGWLIAAAWLMIVVWAAGRTPSIRQRVRSPETDDA